MEKLDNEAKRLRNARATVMSVAARFARDPKYTRLEARLNAAAEEILEVIQDIEKPAPVVEPKADAAEKKQ